MKENDALLAFREIGDVIEKLKGQDHLKEATLNAARILEYSVSFTEYQFGIPIIGRSYYHRSGESIETWNVDFIFYFASIILLHKNDNHYDKALQILEQFMIINFQHGDVGRGNLISTNHCLSIFHFTQ